MATAVAIEAARALARPLRNVHLSTIVFQSEASK